MFQAFQVYTSTNNLHPKSVIIYFTDVNPDACIVPDQKSLAQHPTTKNIASPSPRNPSVAISRKYPSVLVHPSPVLFVTMLEIDIGYA